MEPEITRKKKKPPVAPKPSEHIPRRSPSPTVQRAPSPIAAARAPSPVVKPPVPPKPVTPPVEPAQPIEVVESPAPPRPVTPPIEYEQPVEEAPNPLFVGVEGVNPAEEERREQFADIPSLYRLIPEESYRSKFKTLKGYIAQIEKDYIADYRNYDRMVAEEASDYLKLKMEVAKAAEDQPVSTGIFEAVRVLSPAEQNFLTEQAPKILKSDASKTRIAATKLLGDMPLDLFEAEDLQRSIRGTPSDVLPKDFKIRLGKAFTEMKVAQIPIAEHIAGKVKKKAATTYEELAAQTTPAALERARAEKYHQTKQEFLEEKTKWEAEAKARAQPTLGQTAIKVAKGVGNILKGSGLSIKDAASAGWGAVNFGKPKGAALDVAMGAGQIAYGASTGSVKDVASGVADLAAVAARKLVPGGELAADAYKIGKNVSNLSGHLDDAYEGGESIAEAIREYKNPTITEPMPEKFLNFSKIPLPPVPKMPAGTKEVDLPFTEALDLPGGGTLERKWQIANAMTAEQRSSLAEAQKLYDQIVFSGRLRSQAAKDLREGQVPASKYIKSTDLETYELKKKEREAIQAPTKEELALSWKTENKLSAIEAKAKAKEEAHKVMRNKEIEAAFVKGIDEAQKREQQFADFTKKLLGESTEHLRSQHGAKWQRIGKKLTAEIMPLTGLFINRGQIERDELFRRSLREFAENVTQSVEHYKKEETLLETIESTTDLVNKIKSRELSAKSVAKDLLGGELRLETSVEEPNPLEKLDAKDIAAKLRSAFALRGTEEETEGQTTEDILGFNPTKYAAAPIKRAMFEQMFIEKKPGERVFRHSIRAAPELLNMPEEPVRNLPESFEEGSTPQSKEPVYAKVDRTMQQFKKLHGISKDIKTIEADIAKTRAEVYALPESELPQLPSPPGSRRSSVSSTTSELLRALPEEAAVLPAISRKPSVSELSEDAWQEHQLSDSLPGSRRSSIASSASSSTRKSPVPSLDELLAASRAHTELSNAASAARKAGDMDAYRKLSESSSAAYAKYKKISERISAAETAPSAIQEKAGIPLSSSRRSSVSSVASATAPEPIAPSTPPKAITPPPEEPIYATVDKTRKTIEPAIEAAPAQVIAEAPKYKVTIEDLPYEESPEPSEVGDTFDDMMARLQKVDEDIAAFEARTAAKQEPAIEPTPVAPLPAPEPKKAAPPPRPAPPKFPTREPSSRSIQAPPSRAGKGMEEYPSVPSTFTPGERRGSVAEMETPEPVGGFQKTIQRKKIGESASEEYEKTRQHLMNKLFPQPHETPMGDKPEPQYEQRPRWEKGYEPSGLEQIIGMLPSKMGKYARSMISRIAESETASEATRSVLRTLAGEGRAKKEPAGYSSVPTRETVAPAPRGTRAIEWVEPQSGPKKKYPGPTWAEGGEIPIRKKKLAIPEIFKRKAKATPAPAEQLEETNPFREERRASLESTNPFKESRRPSLESLESSNPFKGPGSRRPSIESLESTNPFKGQVPPPNPFEEDIEDWVPMKEFGAAPDVWSREGGKGPSIKSKIQDVFGARKRPHLFFENPTYGMTTRIPKELEEEEAPDIGKGKLSFLSPEGTPRPSPPTSRRPSAASEEMWWDNEPTGITPPTSEAGSRRSSTGSWWEYISGLKTPSETSSVSSEPWEIISKEELKGYKEPEPKPSFVERIKQVFKSKAPAEPMYFENPIYEEHTGITPPTSEAGSRRSSISSKESRRPSMESWDVISLSEDLGPRVTGRRAERQPPKPLSRGPSTRSGYSAVSGVSESSSEGSFYVPGTSRRSSVASSNLSELGLSPEEVAFIKGEKTPTERLKELGITPEFWAQIKVPEESLRGTQGLREQLNLTPEEYKMIYGEEMGLTPKGEEGKLVPMPTPKGQEKPWIVSKDTGEVVRLTHGRAAQRVADGEWRYATPEEVQRSQKPEDFGPLKDIRKEPVKPNVPKKAHEVATPAVLKQMSAKVSPFGAEEEPVSFWNPAYAGPQPAMPTSPEMEAHKAKIGPAPKEETAMGVPLFPSAMHEAAKKKYGAGGEVPYGARTMLAKHKSFQEMAAASAQAEKEAAMEAETSFINRAYKEPQKPSLYIRPQGRGKVDIAQKISDMLPSMPSLPKGQYVPVGISMQSFSSRTPSPAPSAVEETSFMPPAPKGPSPAASLWSIPSSGEIGTFLGQEPASRAKGLETIQLPVRAEDIEMSIMEEPKKPGFGERIASIFQSRGQERSKTGYAALPGAGGEQQPIDIEQWLEGGTGRQSITSQAIRSMLPEGSLGSAGGTPLLSEVPLSSTPTSATESVPVAKPSLFTRIADAMKGLTATGSYTVTPTPGTGIMEQVGGLLPGRSGSYDLAAAESLSSSLGSAAGLRTGMPKVSGFKMPSFNLPSINLPSINMPSIKWPSFGGFGGGTAERQMPYVPMMAFEPTLSETGSLAGGIGETSFIGPAAGGRAPTPPPSWPGGSVGAPPSPPSSISSRSGITPAQIPAAAAGVPGAGPSVPGGAGGGISNNMLAAGMFGLNALGSVTSAILGGLSYGLGKENLEIQKQLAQRAPPAEHKGWHGDWMRDEETGKVNFII